MYGLFEACKTPTRSKKEQSGKVSNLLNEISKESTFGKWDSGIAVRLLEEQSTESTSEQADKSGKANNSLFEISKPIDGQARLDGGISVMLLYEA